MRTIARSARAPWLTLAAVAVAIALAGCSSSMTPPEADPESPAAAYERTSPWGEGDTALLEGIVALENGCITVVDDVGQVFRFFRPTSLGTPKLASSADLAIRSPQATPFPWEARTTRRCLR